MATSGRGWVWAALAAALLAALLALLALATDAWVSGELESEAGAGGASRLSHGLFRGELELRLLATPSRHRLQLLCVRELAACALSCKTEPAARRDEVAALAQRLRPNPACVAATAIEPGEPLPQAPVLPLPLYAALVALACAQAALAVAGAALGALNAARNPTAWALGPGGWLAANAAAAAAGGALLATAGAAWARSGWREHVLLSYVALGVLRPRAALGWSAGLAGGAALCSLAAAALLAARSWRLARAPPPPTIHVDSSSDGTVFLY